MELKKGQRLRVKEFDKRPKHWNYRGAMDKWMGKIVTFNNYDYVRNIEIFEDKNEYTWKESDFQIVFNKWEDVRKAIRGECYKYTECRNCPLCNELYCYNEYFEDENYKQLTENFKKMFGMECYVLEDEKMNFTLEDIKDEMIVKLRNGIVYISLGKNFIGENGFMPKFKYLSNFKCRSNSDFDIIEIYEKIKSMEKDFKGCLL